MKSQQRFTANANVRVTNELLTHGVKDFVHIIYIYAVN